MVHVTTDLMKRNKDRKGAPDVKNVERTGKDTFVAHTHGKDKFEGKFDSNKYKISGGKIVPR